MSSINLEVASGLMIEAIPAKDMTHECFIDNYFNPRVPVLLKNACANWDFMHKWTQDYLVVEMGDFQCTIARDSRPAYSKEKCSLRDYFQQHSHLSTMTFEPFNTDTQPLPRFLEDIPLPNAFFTREAIDAYFFFHANADGGSLPHCHMDAFNLLQYGTKHWVLYDADPETNPKGWEILKQCHEEYGAGTFSRDWFVDGPDQVRSAGIKLYEGEQEAGDIMFIPEHFSHAILNCSENQGLVVISKRSGKAYQKQAGGSYSPKQDLR